MSCIYNLLSALSVVAVVLGQLPAITESQRDYARTGQGSISGRVINDLGQPIQNAGVFIRRAGVTTPRSRSVGTDEDGRFRADELEAGAYNVSAYAPGYVNEPSIRHLYRIGDSVSIRMIKGGVITGTVTSSTGEPVVAARVSVIRVRDAEGRRILKPSASGNRQTDDRGVYRLYGLVAGSYLVRVNGGDSFSPVSAYEGDAPTYYPSTTRDAATEVTVHTGDEITSIDIRYRGDLGRIVSGTVSGSLGADSTAGGISVTLSHISDGVIEANTFVQTRFGRGFALYGVSDGEYELMARSATASEINAASIPRRVTVKGADVTGLDLALASLAAINGRVILETVPELDRTGACKDRGARDGFDSTLIMMRREAKQSARDQTNASLFPASEGAPNEKGEFTVRGLFSGRYRVEPRLLTEDLYVRSITSPGVAASRPNDVASTGLAVNRGQRVSDLTVTLAEGAATLRGKVVSASPGSALPPNLLVHLAPADNQLSDDVTRFAEASVDYDGAFSVSNLAPGRYYVHARALTDAERSDPNREPITWDQTARAKLWREAKGTNVEVEFVQCQRVTDYVLKFTPQAVTRKPASPRAKP